MAQQLRIEQIEPLLESGTKQPFLQPNAPTGWTQDTSLNDYMLRVVSGTGGGSGGTDSPILNDKIPLHDHTFTTSIDGAHIHTVVAWSTPGSDVSGADATHSASNQSNNTSSNGDHSHTGTTDTNLSASNWTPKYIDTIAATKD